MNSRAVLLMVALVCVAGASGADVCVLGAGPAGLHAADLLSARGYSVTLIEKNNFVGGQVHSVPVDHGQRLDIGATLVVPGYTKTLDYIRKYNITTASFYDIEQTMGDLSQGLRKQIPVYGSVLGDIKRALLVASNNAYIAARAAEFPDIDITGFGTRAFAATSAARKVTTEGSNFASWLAAHGLAATASMLTLPVTLFGYGSLLEIPALYGLKYVNDTGIRSLEPPFAPPGPVRDAMLKDGRFLIWIPAGYQTLFEALAADLATRPNVRILLNADTIAAVRPLAADAPITLTVRPTSDPAAPASTETCGQLLLAFAERLDRLGFMDLDAEERELFAPVVTSAYYSAVVLAADLPHNTAAWNMRDVQLLPVNGPLDGTPNYLFKGGSDYAAVGAYSTSPLDNDAVIAKMLAMAQPYNHNLTLTPAHVKEFNAWDYFPHVPADQMPRFYAAAAKMQGHRNTFYSGSLFDFHCVEQTMRASEKVVNEHFPPKA